VEGAHAAVRVAVGLGLDLLNQSFVAAFGTSDNFSRLPDREKTEYLESLGRAKTLAIENGNDSNALALVLFKMWAAALAAQDVELSGYFSRRLSILSQGTTR
jgi:hypothetical protein